MDVIISIQQVFYENIAMSVQTERKKLSLTQLKKLKQEGQKIASLTAYDSTFAQVLDENGIDWILVGDSLGNIIQGQKTTIPVTVDHMVYHTQCVTRVSQHAYVAADMPFLSYTSSDQALKNAARLMQEGGANMVKLECDSSHLPLVEKMITEGIPVCVHMGLRPQLVEKMGGYRVQGREEEAAKAMCDAAIAFEEVGADILLLESVPSVLAAQISKSVQVPVIGIGAGPDCDGQILVMHDALGFTRGHVPKFAHNFYSDAVNSIDEAVAAYVNAVKKGEFPEAKHCFN